MRVVVTGGLGFLGRHVTARLLAAGHEVRIIDRVSGGVSGAEGVVADVRDEQVVRRVMTGADAVIHAAFAPPQAGLGELRHVNVEALGIVCESAVAQNVPTLVVVSSTIVELPPRPHPLGAGLPLGRLDAYRRSRLAGEQIALGWSDRLRVAVARPQTFLGPGRVGAFALLFDLVHAGRPVPVFGPGVNRYQLLDVRDLAAGLALVAECGHGGVFHFGASDVRSVATELQDLVDHARTGARVVHLPAGLALPAVRAVELAGLPPLSDWHHATARRLDRVSDTSRAVEIGWSPAFTNQACLQAAYDWFAESRARQTALPTTHPVPDSHRFGAMAARIGLSAIPRRTHR